MSQHQAETGMTRTNRLAVNTLSASLILAMGNLQGCGGGGGSGGSVTRPPTESALTLSTNTTEVVPYQAIDVTVKDASGADAAAAETGMMVDVSTSKDFSGALSMLGIPASLSTLSIALPEHETFNVTEATTTMYIRLHRLSDNATSNTITLNLKPTPVSSAKLGTAVAALALIDKAYALASGSNALTTAMKSDGATYQFDQLASFGADAASVERRAWRILYGAYGNQLGTDKITGVTKGGLEHPMFLDNQNVFSPVISCVSEKIGIGSSASAAEADCFDVAESVASNDVPEVINNYMTKFHAGVAALKTATSALASKIRGIPQVAESLTRVAEHVEMATEVNNQMMIANKLSKDPVGEGANLIYEKSLGYAKKRLWKEHDDFLKLDESGQLLLGVGDYKEKMEAMLSDRIKSAPEKAELIKRGFQSFADRVEDRARQVIDEVDSNGPTLPGGTTDAPYGTSADGTPLKSPACALSMFGVPANCGENGTSAMTVDEMCAPAGGASASFPLTSSSGKSVTMTCGQMVTAFSDTEFRNNVLEPLRTAVQAMLPEFQAATAALQACLAANPIPGSCQAESDAASKIAERLNGPFDQFLDGLASNDDDKHSCPSGYTDLGGGEVITCAHSSLVASVNTSTCSPGSYTLSDKGIRSDTSACIWYSRDYFMSDGSCRDHYSKVFFLEKDRCRWTQLPLTSSAIVSVNTKTGEKSILER